jgi:hypothetical protein
MQMIYSKMFVFSVFVCTLGKCSIKYSTLCVWSNVKQTHPCHPPRYPPQSTKKNHHQPRNPQPLQPTPLPTTINKKKTHHQPRNPQPPQPTPQPHPHPKPTPINKKNPSPTTTTQPKSTTKSTNPTTSHHKLTEREIREA